MDFMWIARQVDTNKIDREEGKSVAAGPGLKDGETLEENSKDLRAERLKKERREQASI